MSAAVAALITLKESIAVVKGIADLAAAGKFEKRKTRKILEYLEKLYFTPKGIMPILELLAAGEKVDDGAFSRVLLEFNDGEWDVRSAAEALDFNSLSSADFPLKLRTSLQAAVYGKLSLRSDLQDALNRPNINSVLNSEDAQGLVERIRALNSVLEAIDEQLR